MTQSKHTKRALLASILSVVLCAAMLIGSTFAWFTDSVTSGNNKIVAGNLDIELEYTTDFETWNPVQDATELFKKDALWEPGHAEVVYLRIKNLGSLALKYKFAMNIDSETEATNVNGETFKLSQYLKYGVVEDQKMAFDNRDAAVSAVKNPAALTEYSKEGTLNAKAEDEYLAIVVYMPTEVGNEANYRGDVIPSVDLGVNLVATQTPYEADGFGNDYDANAEYPVIADAHHDAETSEELLTALSEAKEGETTAIHLKDNIVLDQIGNPGDTWKYHYKISGDKEVIFDLAGKEITFKKGVNDSYFTGGILADGSDVTFLNGTVNVSDCTAVYTKTSKSNSVFRNVTFNVTGNSSSYGVQGVGFTEFENCKFNVSGDGYGIFCSRPTSVADCSFKLEGSAIGIQMNNHCNGNIIRNSKFEVAGGTAIYVNNQSDTEISDVTIALSGTKSATGIRVSGDCSAVIGENVVVTNSNTASIAPELVRGSLNFVNITIADGFKIETDSEQVDYTNGYSPASAYKNGTYWKTTPASGN
ncbi:hypothetical protein DPQ25_00740 [Hydrogeniiclostridium mannosilyticum]|uniref:SipW-cognate class signal peptide n=1 Tax=Hydrogeniiclostridium mannosilyticum TaxID=2764322 RepID=A0A328UFC8_9FIRM|nr:right-handed parallel beta-helix repeat-containing protein [Hydrogeniiclostridium mannosilyticum]RAQ30069.1 hypothetical protein DPQ25_00740 [Hydrogeniiclostridium mannosilyticum]